MTTKTEGVVINKIDYAENDEIVTIFTLNYGLITFLARGVKKIISKNKTSLLWLAISEFEIFLSNNKNRLSKLMRGRLKETHLRIVDDFQKSLFLSWFTELIELGFEPREVNPSAYILFVNTLKFINEGFDLLTVTSFFMLKTLAWFGNHWNLNECGRCGTKKNILTFSLAEECLVCEKCISKYEPKFNISFLKLIQNWNLESQKIEVIVDNDYYQSDIKLLHRILIEIYKNKIGITGQAWTKILKYNIFLK